jgi:glycosyltransferase involved in cell wall biosynthesis
MISVIIPVFNRPEAAARAVRSVQAQRGIAASDVEVILVDDASEPPLAGLDADPQVRIIRLDRNAGPSAARNAGIRASTKEYIALLDSDDFWLDEKLQRQLTALKQIEQGCSRNTTALVCSCYYPDSSTRLLQARLPKPASSVEEFASGCWFSPGSALLIRRSTFDTVGLFDEQLRRLEDFEWFLRFGTCGGQLHVLPYNGVIVAPSNSGRSETVSACAKMIELHFSRERLPPKAWRRMQAYLALECGRALVLERRRLKGLSLLIASWCFKPRSQMQVDAFWQRSEQIPAYIEGIYSEMKRKA